MPKKYIPWLRESTSNKVQSDRLQDIRITNIERAEVKVSNKTVTRIIEKRSKRPPSYIPSNSTPQATTSSPSIGYFFYQAVTGVGYKKSLDRGQSWGDLVQISSNYYGWLTVWADAWNPSYAGNKIHILWTDGDDVSTWGLHYGQLDTSNDELLIDTRLIAPSNPIDPPYVSGTGVYFSEWGTVVRANSGSIYATWKTNDSSGSYFFKSIDEGETWVSLPGPWEDDNGDMMLLFPSDEEDDDLIGIYWDRSAGEISRKLYNGSWVETSIAQPIRTTDDDYTRDFDGALRSDGKIMLAAFDWPFTGGGDPNHGSAYSEPTDVRSFIIGATSIEEKTQIYSNEWAAIGPYDINIRCEPNGDISIATRYDDFFPGIPYSIAQRKISTDDMETWEPAEDLHSTINDGYTGYMAGGYLSMRNGVYYPMWERFGNPGPEDYFYAWDSINEVVVEVANDVGWLDQNSVWTMVWT